MQLNRIRHFMMGAGAFAIKKPTRCGFAAFMVNQESAREEGVGV